GNPLTMIELDTRSLVAMKDPPIPSERKPDTMEFGFSRFPHRRPSCCIEDIFKPSGNFPSEKPDRVMFTGQVVPTSRGAVTMPTTVPFGTPGPIVRSVVVPNAGPVPGSVTMPPVQQFQPTSTSSVRQPVRIPIGGVQLAQPQPIAPPVQPQ